MPTRAFAPPIRRPLFALLTLAAAVLIPSIVAIFPRIAAAGPIPPAAPPAEASAGVQARYDVLTSDPHHAAPVDAVEFRLGPAEQYRGHDGHWSEMRLEKSGKPLVSIRLLRAGGPFAADSAILRYLVQFPGQAAPVEYANIHTHLAQLPLWRRFAQSFLPVAARSASLVDGIPQTALLLGQTLSLQSTRQGAPWAAWPEPNRLELDPELLIGTSRNFKDKENARLPQTPRRQEYTYIPLEKTDFDALIDAGFNLFNVDAKQLPLVQDRPVFYVKPIEADELSRYPADFYRANFFGVEMFTDEPTIRLVGDANVNRTLRFFSDAASLVVQRAAFEYTDPLRGAEAAVMRALAKGAINTGALRIEQSELPIWETLISTSHYALQSPASGIVHEGRYQLPQFQHEFEKWTGEKPALAPAEMLRWHYATMRGAARANGKSWGTAIYGQCDPALAPLALTTAYDMGARYLWFWTSDHDHHVPFPEQLALARAVKSHAHDHPRPSLDHPDLGIAQGLPAPEPKLQIVIPSGYFLELSELWWIRVLDKDLANPAALHYRAMLKQALLAAHAAFAAGQDFDIVVDDPDHPSAPAPAQVRLK